MTIKGNKLKRFSLVSLTMASLAAISLNQSVARAQEEAHVVQPGDNLYRLSIKYGTTVENLKKLNNLSDDNIYPGQTILVTVSQFPATDSAASNPDTQTQPATNSNQSVSQPSANAPAAPVAPAASGRVYTVQAGDYLNKIASQYGVTSQQLRTWNALTSDMIHPGQQLILAAPSSGAASGTTTTEPVQASPGSSTSTASPRGTGRYTVQSGDWLAAIAQRHGVTVSQLKTWNNLSSDLIHPGQDLIVQPVTTTRTEFTDGTSQSTRNVSVNGASQSTNSTASPTQAVYTVQAGDYINKIANQYGISSQDLKAWNGLSSNLIHPGQKLFVVNPNSATSSRPNSPERPASQPSTNSSTTSSYYTVQRGEWLSAIAQRHGVTVDQLKSWNNLTSDLIHPGQQLIVQASRTPAPNQSTSNTTGATSGQTDANKIYTVQSGDYLYKIAQTHGISVQNLKDWNNLTSNTLRTGDRLYVSQPVASDNQANQSVSNSGNSTTTSNELKTYQVRAGDYLNKIASANGISVADLKAWNNLSSNLIHPGQQLYVSNPRTSSNANKVDQDEVHTSNNIPSANPTVYTVRPGDYIYKIANSYGITADDLRVWNNLNSDTIYAGQQLVVTQPAGRIAGVGNYPKPSTNNVTTTAQNYSVKVRGIDEPFILGNNFYASNPTTVPASQFLGERFTVTQELVDGNGRTYVELSQAGTVKGYLPKSAVVSVPANSNVIYIDAGHGGSETGAYNFGVAEKDLNLNITNQLSRRLRELGYTVYETRTSDQYVDLKTRQNEPNALMPDVYLSVHHNASGPANSNARGIETLYHSRSVDEPGYAAPSYHSDAMLRDSRSFAEDIQRELIKTTGAVNRGTRAQNLHVNRTTNMPSALVELGFQDNRSEFNLLTTEEYQQKLINGLVNGINAYFGRTR